MAQLNVELIVRKGTAEEWGSSSYVLKAGEWGYDTTNKIAKIGDGTSLWAALPRTGVTYTLQAGDANGEIKLVGADGSSSSAKVTGLGALAYKGTVELTDLASGIQASLGKADSAVQSVVTGGANGTISVDGSDVAVKGLGNAAYVNTDAFDAAGAATAAVAAHNTAGDAHSDIRGSISTLSGRVDSAESEIDALQAQIGGLSGAMHYVGDSSTDPTGDTGPTIEDHPGEYQSGDVCTYQKGEYVYDGTTWRLLGDEGSYLTKTEAASTYETKENASSAHQGLQTAIDTLTASVGNCATKTELGAVSSAVDAVEADVAGLKDGSIQAGNAAVAVGYAATGGIATKFASVDSAVGNAQTAAEAAQATADEALAAVGNIQIPDVPVKNVVGDGAVITVGNSAGTFTVSHKAYSTGALAVEADEPYFIDSITVENGHATAATAKSLATALGELGTLTLYGGKADGTY